MSLWPRDQSPGEWLADRLRDGIDYGAILLAATVCSTGQIGQCKRVTGLLVLRVVFWTRRSVSGTFQYRRCRSWFLLTNLLHIDTLLSQTLRSRWRMFEVLDQGDKMSPPGREDDDRERLVIGSTVKRGRTTVKGRKEMDKRRPQIRPARLRQRHRSLLFGLIAAVLTSVAGSASAQTVADVDFDGDGEVGFGDFLMFAGAYDTTQPAYDLDANGRVEFDDFLTFAGFYGQSVFPVVNSELHLVVDTGQDQCYGAQGEIPCPSIGQPFYGQDGQHDGNASRYTLANDSLTVFDQVTGLTWQRSPDTDHDNEIGASDKMNWGELQAYPATLNAQGFGGYTDWRLPTIKELYSLIDFSGVDPNAMSTNTSDLVPFIDTNAFTFAYGDLNAGERIIDAQYASATLYVGSTSREQLLFGVNFADGRIKGYGLVMPGGRIKTFFVICTRGSSGYGANDLIDNGDRTVTDRLTSLMWTQDDSAADAPGGLDWEEAFAWADAKNSALHLGFSDWRLPNAKELQSILDYERSPLTTGSAAISPLFNATQITNEAGQPDYPYYWSSTTHVNFMGGASAVYVSFGKALGYMHGAWIDVHGAGAQRSDPKAGDPGRFPWGRGPQGDAIRIYNFVRLVRDIQ